MSGLPLLSSREIVTALQRDGFLPKDKSRRGSHQAFVKDLPDGKKLVAIVPVGKREIPKGTLKSILRQANLSEERLRELL